MLSRTRILSTLVFTGAALTSLTAHAFGSSPTPMPPTPIGNEVDCTQPATLSADGASGTCTNRDYLQQCDAQRPACEQLLGPAFQQFYAANAGAVAQVKLPASIPHQVDATHDGLLGTPYDAVKLRTAAPATNVAGTGATFSTLPAPTITPGDQAIHGCNEYVFKKWLGYSQIDDYMRTARDRALTERASHEVPFFLTQPFDRVDGQPIDANGTALTLLAQGTVLQRNAFVKAAKDFLDARDPAQGAILRALQGKDPSFAIQEANDADMAYVLFAELATANDEVLRDIPQRIAALQTTIVTNQPGANVLGAVEQTIYQWDAALDCLGGDGAACWYWKGRGGDTYVQAAKALPKPDPRDDDYGTDSGDVIPRRYIGAKPAKGSAWYQSAIAQAQTQLPAAQAQADADVAAYRKIVQQAILAEWSFDASHGCLGYGPNQFENVCDVAPTWLEDHYANLFQSEREAAYDRCIADTGDDFTLFSDGDRMAKIFHNPIYANARWPQSLSFFETFLADYENRDALNSAFDKRQEDKQRQLLAAEATSAPLTGPATIGESKQDSQDIGGDWFGAGYEYDAAWHVTPKTTNPSDATTPICELDGDVGAHVEAHATVFKKSFPFLDAALYVSSVPGKATLNKAHFTFLGNNYFNDDGKDFTGATYNQSVVETPLSPSITAEIPIYPFVLEVAAGFDLKVGLNASAAVVAPPTICDTANPSWSLKGTIDPFVHSDAYADVDVSLLVVKAGVEGRVDLVDVDLPFTADAHLASNSTTGVNVVFDEDAKLALTELAGHVSLFAEVDYIFGSNRAEVELAHWDGFHQDVPLWSLHTSYPLDALNARLFGHLVPGDPYAPKPTL